LAKIDSELLLFLASKAGLNGTALTSTSKIARQFGMSQQSASRKLRELQKSSLIELSTSPLGCSVKISKKGIDVLRKNFLSLQFLFEGKRKARISGILKSGLGEGKYYISRPFYLKQFKKLLGFKPFFGTLNIVIDPAELQDFLEGLPLIEITGFKTEERSFGKIKAFKVAVQGKQPASLIIPERTAHSKSEIEIIAPVNLRKKFSLKEGSKLFLKQA